MRLMDITGGAAFFESVIDEVLKSEYVEDPADMYYNSDDEYAVYGGSDDDIFYSGSEDELFEDISDDDIFEDQVYEGAGKRGSIDDITELIKQKMLNYLSKNK